MNLLTVLLLVLAASSADRETPRTDVEAVARALQQKYDTVRDFSADFVHAYQGGVLRKQALERGHVLIKKPGKMRWTYRTPEEKLFISDGVRMYSYIPADKQVYVSQVPGADQAPTPVLFLAGKGNLLRDFHISPGSVPQAPAGTTALKLTPKQPERDYETLTLVVDQQTLQLRMLATTDRQGGQSTFTFSNLKENVGIGDREFVFKIPRGTDVIADPPPSP